MWLRMHDALGVMAWGDGRAPPSQRLDRMLDGFEGEGCIGSCVMLVGSLSIEYGVANGWQQHPTSIVYRIIRNGPCDQV
jgi:hypothetical protein